MCISKVYAVSVCPDMDWLNKVNYIRAFQLILLVLSFILITTILNLDIVFFSFRKKQ